MKKLPLTLAALALGSVMNPAAADVVTSIKPLAFIAAEIAQGVTNTTSLVSGTQSPHTFQLSPSKLEEIKKADLFVYVANDMEISLGKALKNPKLAPKYVIQLGTLPEVTPNLLKSFHFDHEDVHDHEGHDHEHDHDHKHDHDKDHDHQHDHSHDHNHDHHHHDHSHAGYKPNYSEKDLSTDYHLWTSPEMAKITAEKIAAQLSVVYPDKKELIQQNLANFVKGLEQTTAEIKEEFAKVQLGNFIVYHEAYNYFEKAFNISQYQKGAIYFNVSVEPSAKQLDELHERGHADHIVAIFTEPQFNKAIAKKLASAMHDVNVGVLDPLGSTIEIKPGSYGQFLKNMATDFINSAKVEKK